MSKSDIVSMFYQTNESLNAKTIVLLLLAGLAVGAVIFATYRITYTGVNYSFRFNLSNVIILLITIVIMIMISSNIVITMGMVGALSIVRFRTAIKDPRDTVFIFWSVVEGLSVGSQNIKLAAISTVFIALVLCIAGFVKGFGVKYLVVVRMTAAAPQEVIRQTVIRNSKRARVRAVNTDVNGCEMIFEILCKKDPSVKLNSALASIEGVSGVHTLLETGETVG